MYIYISIETIIWTIIMNEKLFFFLREGFKKNFFLINDSININWDNDISPLVVSLGKKN